MNDSLGVAICAVPVSRILQAATELKMIEDFAVIDDLQRTGLVPHRLMAGRQIDNA